jgi:hypothetical protein
MNAIKTRPSWPDPTRATVEVLVLPGSPGTELAIARVREAAEALGIVTNLRLVTIDGEEQAHAHAFVGSPTVRVDGEDVERDAAARPVGLRSRVYGAEAAPPLALIRAALKRSSTELL